jgi:protein-tyrosine phosphatase
MPDGLVDIHAHILPGIDDGPPDLKQALAMARAASDAGISTLAATPHLRQDFPDVHVDELASRCETMRDAIARAGIELELVSGAEVSLAWALEASSEDLRLASYGQRGTDLLIETPATTVGGLAELLYQVRVQGFRVTLAHPERSASFQSNPAQLAELVGQDVLVQVNASSLRRDRRGSPLQRLAARLCRDGLAHVIASDGHRAAAWRPVTELPVAVDRAAALVGPPRADWLTRHAPMAILAGEKLPEAPAFKTRSVSRRGFGRR